jgi:phthiocerol/phenolphthiocerol synthesis type-I polyketide synthase C
MRPDQARGTIQRAIAAEVGRILRLPANNVAPDTPLNRLGLDSLGGLELRTALERRFSASISLDSVGEDLTVNHLTQRLLDSLPPPREAAE